MEQMLIVHISSLSAIIILSIVLLVNSIKTKNKLVMYLSIGTLVVSIGCLTYCLIHHFNEQHQDDNHVTVSSPVYNKSKQNIKELLEYVIKTSTPERGMFDKKQYNILKECLSKPKLIADLTNQLLKNKSDKFIEELLEINKMNVGGDGNRNPVTNDKEKMLYFTRNILTVMTTDCKDATSIVEKLTDMLKASQTQSK